MALLLQVLASLLPEMLLGLLLLVKVQKVGATGVVIFLAVQSSGRQNRTSFTLTTQNGTLQVSFLLNHQCKHWSIAALFKPGKTGARNKHRMKAHQLCALLYRYHNTHKGRINRSFKINQWPPGASPSDFGCSHCISRDKPSSLDVGHYGLMVLLDWGLS